MPTPAARTCDAYGDATFGLFGQEGGQGSARMGIDGIDAIEGEGATDVDARWLDCFGEGCRFVASREIDGMREGRIMAGAATVGTVHDGVVDLTSSPDGWDSNLLEQFARDGVIEQNWNRSNGKGDSDIARELAALDGPICEVAAGPGGGFMPRVRQLNPQARIMVNDVSPSLLTLWSRFLSGQGLDDGLCFAAFDATRSVLRPGCLAAVSSLSGFCNIAPGAVLLNIGAIRRGDAPASEFVPAGLQPQAEAVRCVADALRSGGVLFAEEATFDSAAWADLPTARREEWERRWAPWLAFSPVKAVIAAGLRVVKHEVSPGRVIDPEDSEAAHDAARYGITLRTQREYIQAVKP